MKSNEVKAIKSGKHPASSLAPNIMRKDHRIWLKVIEVKLNKPEEIDTYCVIRTSEDANVNALSATVAGAVMQGASIGGGSTGGGGAVLKSTRSSERLAVGGSNQPSHRRSTAHAGPQQELRTLGKTKTAWASKTPWFDDEFETDLNDGFSSVIVELRQKTLLKDKLLGVFALQKVGLELDGKTHEDWYSLRRPANVDDDPDEKRVTKTHDYQSAKFAAPQTCDKCRGVLWGVSQAGVKCGTCSSVCHPKCAQSMGATCGVVGTLRLKYLYVEEFILPPGNYSNLMELLTDEHFNVVKVLGRTTDEREEVAKTLVTIFEDSQQAVKFLSAVAVDEIRNTADANTIFRANSLGSKAIDQYMKLVGIKYLQATLKPIITEIIGQSRPCEIDPTRVAPGDNLEAHFTVLEAYIKWCIDRILNSARECPLQLKQVFHVLRREAMSRFPTDKVVSSTVVTAFIFLRFFNAAILGPQLFGLSPDKEPPDAKNARTFTLISKTIQQLANMTPFEKAKEPYMVQLNHLIIANIPRLKKFLDEITCEQSEAKLAKLNRKVEKRGLFGKKANATTAEAAADALRRVHLERQNAAIHRHLIRNVEKMAGTCTDAETADMMKLQSVLNEMQDAHAKLSDELKEARRLALLSLEADASARLGKSPSTDRLAGSSAQLNAQTLGRSGNILKSKSQLSLNHSQQPSVDDLAVAPRIQVDDVK